MIREPGAESRERELRDAVRRALLLVTLSALGSPLSAQTLQLRPLATTPAFPYAIDSTLGLKIDSLKQTPRGTWWRDVEPGLGEPVAVGDQVAVLFIGFTADGKLVTQSRPGDPLRFTVGAGKVIDGWEDGVVGMRVGGRRQLVLSPDLAYGAKGSAGIPGNTVLVFDLILMERKR